MVKPYIFQVVGFQNSGKTTYLNHLLEKLNGEKIRVGTIKHHGHGGKPDINENKDSAKYSRTGALASLVEGDGRLLIQAEKSAWLLEEQIEILAPFQLNIILVEGHKYESFPKAVIINEEKELCLLEELKNVVVVFFRERLLSLQKEKKLDVPHFHLEDDECFQWTIQFIKSQLKK